MKKVLKNDFITTRWSGGTTSQIFIDPIDADVAKKDFDFRISSATCELESSIFTPYGDFNRFITPIDGSLKLTVNGEDVFLKPYDIYFFDGSDDVVSEGKVRDYNLIVRKGHNGSMYAKYLENDRLVIDSNYKNIVIFNYDGDFTYAYRGNINEFEDFSSVVLVKNESIDIKGTGHLLICEIE